jgi:hypothetical protein
VKLSKVQNIVNQYFALFSNPELRILGAIGGKKLEALITFGSTLLND